MKIRIYDYLVNKHPDIRLRYHKVHDGSRGVIKLLSWAYLLWLNFAYYILQMKFFGCIPEANIYESRRLNCRQSESGEYLSKNAHLSVDRYVEILSAYEIISFDIFDTLIFRPFAVPADLFYMVGNELGIMDFKNIRSRAEWDARMKLNAMNGNMEVSLSDIWKNLQETAGVSSVAGQLIENRLEQKLCYANPFMLEVWNRLIEKDKKVVIVSDMYLSKDAIVRILETAGFTGVEKVYISSEYHKNKAGGKLFREVIQELYGIGMDTKMKQGNNLLKCNKVNQNPNMLSLIHVGDNPYSDLDKARESGIDVLPYQNTKRNMLLYRAYDMSPMIGSAYRRIVSNWLYNGLYQYSMEYEYGFIYGGLFVLGYCGFIHEYCDSHDVDKLLFLSRDGDILKQVYDYLYPDENTEYVYWSRKAAAKLGAVYDRHDYFRRFIYHKINQNYTIREILASMELDFLADELYDREINLRPEDNLTDKNGYLLRRFIEAEWDKVIAVYKEQDAAAYTYYYKTLSDVRKAAAIDIGWAGSGAMTLRKLAGEHWKLPCEIIGIIAGTNTVHNAEPDAAEPFLQSGKLVSYLFSQNHNRDLLKLHNPNRNYNVYWELLLSSPTQQFHGFYRNRTFMKKCLSKTAGYDNIILGC